MNLLIVNPNTSDAMTEDIRRTVEQAKSPDVSVTVTGPDFGPEALESLDQQRAELARLLDETDLPVAEVAARVGMVDVAYFSRLFKKKYGLSPLRYRARPAEG